MPDHPVQIAICGAGSSLLRVHPRREDYHRIYGVNHAPLALPDLRMDGFMALDGNKKRGWEGYQWPAPKTPYLRWRDPEMKRRWQVDYSFPMLIRYVAQRHGTGVHLHFYGVDMTGTNAVTGQEVARRRWNVERDIADAELEAFPRENVRSFGLWKPAWERPDDPYAHLYDESP